METKKTEDFPDWYSPQTGIYQSKFPPVDLPSDPFLDVVSFIFSDQLNGQLALIDSSSGYHLSYSDLYSLVKSMAAGLRNAGVSQGDVVLILLPNSIFYPIIVMGVLHLGAIVTTMNPRSNISEIKKQCAECNVCFAFTESESVGKLQALGFPVVGVPENVDLDSKPVGFSSFDQFISCSLDSTKRPVINQQDTAAILFSSGTTGASKGVVLTHRNFIAMVELFVRFEASLYKYPSWNNVVLAIMPMFHIYGLCHFCLGLLSLGCSIVVMKSFDANEMVKAIERERVTHLTVVPPILRSLTNAAKHFNGSLQSLKQVCCGATAVRKTEIDEFVLCLPRVDFIQGYGMTESTAVATRGLNTKKFKNYSSAGLLAPSMEAKIVDYQSGSSLPPGDCGELCLRGPAVMKVSISFCRYFPLINTNIRDSSVSQNQSQQLHVASPIGAPTPFSQQQLQHAKATTAKIGYLNNVEATLLTIDRDGWLHTGDIVYFDNDGYLYIVDRVKEIIKYKGFQIAPADLEDILLSHPNILEAAVIGWKDEECGEIPVAFVVVKPGAVLSHQDVINYVSKQVAPYKKVREVVFAKSIPKSAAGKVLRRELKNQMPAKL